MSEGNHKRVFHYDGSFRCLDCLKAWGALADAPKDAPEECVMIESLTPETDAVLGRICGGLPQEDDDIPF